jgi:Zn-finger nucleic acid-binding protein
MKCPRCENNLENGLFDLVSLWKCMGCQGVLIEQKNMIRLMETVRDSLVGKIDFTTPIPPQPDADGDTSCPKCREAMETHGYLGGNTVWIDRCPDCWLVWADPSELLVMARLYAQNQHHIEEHKVETRDAMHGIDTRLMARTLSSVFNAIPGQMQPLTNPVPGGSPKDDDTW